MFNKEHTINLLWYLWIWFISGSISHGFFSGTRSIIMAVIWITLFLWSEYLTPWKKNYKELFIFWLIYALAVWMVSGWFQHFLDSPMRSLWIIPVGYFVSLLIFPFKTHQKGMNWQKSLLLWWVVSIALAVVAYLLIHNLPESVFSDIGWHHWVSESEVH